MSESEQGQVDPNCVGSPEATQEIIRGCLLLKCLES